MGVRGRGARGCKWGTIQIQEGTGLKGQKECATELKGPQGIQLDTEGRKGIQGLAEAQGACESRKFKVLVAFLVFYFKMDGQRLDGA